MSLLVEGMTMPKSCAECRINCDMLMTGYLNGFAEGAVKRHECCPLVEVPPHGNLIDADELRRVHTEAERGRYGGLYLVGDNRFMQRFEAAPIVIEAEVTQ